LLGLRAYRSRQNWAFNSLSLAALGTQSALFPRDNRQAMKKVVAASRKGSELKRLFKHPSNPFLCYCCRRHSYMKSMNNKRTIDNCALKNPTSRIQAQPVGIMYSTLPSITPRAPPPHPQLQRLSKHVREITKLTRNVLQGEEKNVLA